MISNSIKLLANLWINWLEVSACVLACVRVLVPGSLNGTQLDALVITGGILQQHI